MGLIPPADDEEARRITAGEKEEDGSPSETQGQAGEIREAELLEEFDRLGQQDLN